MIKISDDIFNNIKWEKIKVAPEKIASLFTGNTKILGTEVVGVGLPEPEGLIFYLDNGKNYIEVIDIFSNEDNTNFYGSVAVNKGKIKKSEVLIYE